MLDPLLACDLGLPEILINVSCFPRLTCRTPVLTLTISLGTVPHISSSWAETYFPMFNNPTNPQTHTVPQTSEECPRPLMRPRFPNAKTLFNRFLLPQSPSSDKNLVTIYFRFHFRWYFTLVWYISIQMLMKSTRILPQFPAISGPES